MAETLIIIIPKIDNPAHHKNFRPISLRNVAYKVISEVLVNRLRPFLDKLIGPWQNSFIPHCGTGDNAIIVQEVLHYMNKNKTKKGYLAFHHFG